MKANHHGPSPSHSASSLMDCAETSIPNKRQKLLEVSDIMESEDSGGDDCGNESEEKTSNHNFFP
jgi:hypothetical protein